MFDYISAEGLDNLKHYHYTGVDLSLMAKYFLRRHWNWAVQLFPVWMAPNMITLLGFISISSTTPLLLWLSPDVASLCPWWFYVYSALMIYLYQVFDNVDGRQARRTGTSSPLGELFDHGCDSLFVTCCQLLLANCFGMGQWWTIFMLMFVVLPFYTSHLEEYHTGTLVLDAMSNPTEGQWAAIGACLFTAVFGDLSARSSGPQYVDLVTLGAAGCTSDPSWWAAPLCRAVAPLTASQAFVLMMGVPVVISSALNLVKVLRTSKNLSETVLVAIPQPLNLLLTFVWVHRAALVTPRLTPHIVIFIGLHFSIMLNRMLIARITIQKFNYWNPVPIIVPAIGLASTFLLPIPQRAVFAILYIITVLIFSHFVANVISLMTKHLNISCLSIPYSHEAHSMSSQDLHAMEERAAAGHRTK